MSPVGALIIYILLWWLTFFAVLPMGVQGRWESDDDEVKGADPGAPMTPDIKKKLKLTTLISLGLWMIVTAVILSGIFNFYE